MLETYYAEKQGRREKQLSDTTNAGGRITVTPGLCIGAGNCVEQAEQYFDQNDDDAKVVVLQDLVAPQDRAQVQRAVNICPVQALKLVDA